MITIMEWKNVEGAEIPEWLQGRGTGEVGKMLILTTGERIIKVFPGETIACNGATINVNGRIYDWTNYSQN